MQSTCEDFKASLFICMYNEKLYGNITKVLDNRQLFQYQTSYPVTMDKAYQYLQNYQSDRHESKHFKQEHVVNQGLAFVNQTGQKTCHGCGKMDQFLWCCSDTTADEKKKIYAVVKKGGRPSPVHAYIDGANMELRECFDGVANVKFDLDDARIVMKEDIYADGMLDEVGFFQPSEHEVAKMTCGQDGLFLDSHAMNHTMFATEHLTYVQHTKIFLC